MGRLDYISNLMRRMAFPKTAQDLKTLPRTTWKKGNAGMVTARMMRLEELIIWIVLLTTEGCQKMTRLSEIMEDYATNQDLWLGDFIAAFERMTRNGYEDGDLTDAPPSWKPAILTQCKKKSSMI